MQNEKENIYHLLAAGGENIKLVQQVLKGQPTLKKELEEELLPVLQSVGIKTLRGLPKFLKEFDKHLQIALKKDRLSPPWFASPFIKKYLDNFKTLALKNTRFDTLPASIGQLASLHTLKVIYCQLRQLPDTIGDLQKLTTIHLWGNKHLTHLPDTIGNLSKLKVLKLRNNGLLALPTSIGQLVELKELDLAGDKPTKRLNKITNLPDSFKQLKKLSILNLWENNLTEFPLVICELPQLKKLDLGSNSLTSLPKSLGQLIQLSELQLSNNKLKTLPESLGQLTQLTILRLDNNKLSSLPNSLGQLTQLKKLFLGNNHLNSLPDSLQQLNGLERLFLLNNPIPMHEIQKIKGWLPNCKVIA